MSLDKESTVTDALEAIKALREELISVKDELSSSKSEVSLRFILNVNEFNYIFTELLH